MGIPKKVKVDATKPVVKKSKGLKAVSSKIAGQKAMNSMHEDASIGLPDTLAKQYAIDYYNSDRFKGSSDGIAMDGFYSFGYHQGCQSLIRHAYEMHQESNFYPDFLGFANLAGLYQNSLISAAINTLADDQARCFPIFENKVKKKDDESNELLDRLKYYSEEYDLHSIFHGAYIFNGFFGGCLIYIDTGTDDPTKPLVVSEYSEELRNGKFKGFTLIEPINVTPGIYNSYDPTRKDYYVPKEWFVLSRRIHSSRLIHIRSGYLPTTLLPAFNFMGYAHAQMLLDYAMHFNVARASVSRLLDSFSQTILKTDMLSNLEGDPDQIIARLKVLADLKSNDSVVAIDNEGEDLVINQTSLGGVRDIVQQMLEFFAVIDRKPATKLLGISPSGFNSTGDNELQNYSDSVASQMEKYRPWFKKCIDIIQIVKEGKIDKSIHFVFPPLNEENKNVQAQTMLTYAQALDTAIEGGYLSRPEARRKFNNTFDLGLDLDAKIEKPQLEGIIEGQERDVDVEENMEEKIQRDSDLKWYNRVLNRLKNKDQ